MIWVPRVKKTFSLHILGMVGIDFYYSCDFEGTNLFRGQFASTFSIVGSLQLSQHQVFELKYYILNPNIMITGSSSLVGHISDCCS
jgi:hypothetical protein